MSQTEKKGVPHKILVKNKNPGTISTGANTVVELDGKPIKYGTFFKMEVKPKGLVKVTIELYADVEFEGEVELVERQVDDTVHIIRKTPHVISRLEPVVVSPTHSKSNPDIV